MTEPSIDVRALVERHRAMMEQERALDPEAFDAAVGRMVDRMDPTGRLRELIEGGPEGHAAWREKWGGT